MKTRFTILIITGIILVTIIISLYKSIKTDDIVNGTIGFGKPSPTVSIVSKDEQDQKHKKMIEIAMNYEPLKLLMKENSKVFSFEVIKVPGTNKEVVQVRKKVGSFVFLYYLTINIETGQSAEASEFNNIIDADKAMTIASKTSLVLKNMINVKNYVEFFSDGSSEKYPSNYSIVVKEYRKIEDGGEISYSYSVNIETGKVEREIID